MDAVSRAGARGPAQFMPSSRRIALRRFGLDPWRTREEAVLATVEHLLGGINGRTVLFGYNPRGSPWYQRYILGQPIPLRGRRPARPDVRASVLIPRIGTFTYCSDWCGAV